MKDFFRKPTLFLVLSCILIGVGVPFGFYALMLDGGAMLGGVIVLGGTLLIGLILLFDRIAVRFIKPIIVSLIELLLIIIAFIFYHTF